jgi:capsular polysaccharide biosynthesis protein
MELKHYFDILRRWGWIMLLCIVLAGVSSYWFSSRQPKVYEAQARYLVGPVMDNPNVSSNDLRATSQIGQTYAQIATSRPILQGVIDKLNLNVKADTLSTWVTTTWIDAPQILNIRVRAPDPDMAAQIANQIGEALVERSPSGPTSLQVARRQAAQLQIIRLQDSLRATQSEIDQLAEQIQQATDPVLQRALIVRLDQRRAQLA